jgi:glutathione S-transferase
MLKLHGFAASNYANMVHLALLEKGVPFEYVQAYPDQSPGVLAKSPRGKVPYLETPDGFINETNVILEYLEDLGTGRRLLPTDPYQRAQVRALMKEIELYLELPARSCYIEAFFGGTVPDAIKEKARVELTAGIAALQRHAKFSPYVAGAEFTLSGTRNFRRTWPARNSPWPTSCSCTRPSWQPPSRSACSGSTCWRTCRRLATC